MCWNMIGEDRMSTRIQKLAVLCLFFVMVMMLASCEGSGIGAIPSGTPDHGNGTPAVIPTPDPSPVGVASPSTKGAYYAFVRKNQLWVAVNGTSPVQMTNFDYRNVPTVFWHAPTWSPQDHFIAGI